MGRAYPKVYALFCLVSLLTAIASHSPRPPKRQVQLTRIAYGINKVEVTPDSYELMLSRLVPRLGGSPRLGLALQQPLPSCSSSPRARSTAQPCPFDDLIVTA